MTAAHSMLRGLRYVKKKKFTYYFLSSTYANLVPGSYGSHA